MNPVVAAVALYLEAQKSAIQEKTAGEWLNVLSEFSEEYWVLQSCWPKTPRYLSYIFRRSHSDFLKLGIHAVQDTRGGMDSKRKIWRLIITNRLT